MEQLGDRPPKSGSELLIEFKQSGHQQPFEEIVRRYGAMVFSTCLEVTKDRHDAEDATQAAFLALAVQGKQQQDIKYLGPWLQQVARRLSLDIRRSKKRRSRREDVHCEINKDRYSEVDQPQVQHVDAQELKATISEELNQLPAKYRLPLILHYFGGLDREELATELKVKSSTLGVRLHRGRQMLRERLVRRGVSISETALGVILGYAIHSAVTDSLVHPTAQTAAAVMGGFGNGGAVASHTLAMAHGASGAMMRAKLRFLAILLAIGGSTLAAGAGLVKGIHTFDFQPQIKVSDFIRPLLRSMLPDLRADAREREQKQMEAIAAAVTAQQPPAPVAAAPGTSASDSVRDFLQKAVEVAAATVHSAASSMPSSSAGHARSEQTSPTAPVARGGSNPLTIEPPFANAAYASRAGATLPGGAGSSVDRVVPRYANDSFSDDDDDALMLSIARASGVGSGGGGGGRSGLRAHDAVAIADPEVLSLRPVTIRPADEEHHGKHGGKRGGKQDGKRNAPETLAEAIVSAKDGDYFSIVQTNGFTSSPLLTIGNGELYSSVTQVDEDGTGGLVTAGAHLPRASLNREWNSAETYALRAGELVAETQIIGPAGDGTLIHSGGRNTASRIHLTPTDNGSATYRLTGGTLQLVTQSLDLGSSGIEIGGAGHSKFILGNAETTGSIRQVGEGYASLVVSSSGAGASMFRGWGNVRLHGALHQNGQVIADGYGQDRSLNLASFATVSSTLDNVADVDDRGWFARNGGRLLLPAIPVPAGTSAHNWGEDPSDTQIDLINSARVEVVDAVAAGEMKIALLAIDRADVPTLPMPHHFIGVWSIDLGALDAAAVNLTVRYDDVAARDQGLPEEILKLWVFADGQWTRIMDDSLVLDTLNNTISGHAPGTITHFAVSAPEPGAIVLLLVGAGAMMRRRRRS